MFLVVCSQGAPMILRCSVIIIVVLLLLLPGTKESAAGQTSHLRNSGNGSRMALGNSLQKTVPPVSSMQISVVDIN